MSRRPPVPYVLAMRLAFLLALASLASVSPTRPQPQPAARPVPLDQLPLCFTNSNFEEGTLSGWTKTGKAFDAQPTCGDNSDEQRQRPAHPEGRFWIGTYEDHQCKDTDPPERIQGDSLMGTLISDPFVVTHRYITFLVGGGNSPRTCVELIQRVRTVATRLVPTVKVVGEPKSGLNNEAMRREYWDVESLKDQQVQIAIIDQVSEGWGHINADDFRFSDYAPGDVVAVPLVKGHTLEDAGRILAESSLTGVVTAVRGGRDELRRDVIFDQDPEAGTQVLRNNPVNLTLDAWAVVPDLARLRWTEAQAAIAREELRPDKPRARSRPLPADAVVDSQMPGPGARVPRLSPVTVWLAAPPPVLVKVPGVEGRPLAEARDVITRARFTVNTVPSGADGPSWFVVRQTPDPDSDAPVGSPVGLEVEEHVSVPDVRGWSYAVARDSLRAVGLRASPDFGPGATATRGTTVEQHPRPDTLVRKGSPVTLDVRYQPVLSAVPALVGLPVAAARERVTATGLRWTTPTLVDSARDGIVFRQAPAYTARVPAATPVYVWVGTLVRVPPVTGLRLEAARDSLRRAGFRQDSVSYVETSGDSNIVMAQSPPADSLCARGRSVALTVSRRGGWPLGAILMLIGAAAAGVAVGAAWGPVGRAIRKRIRPRLQPPSFEVHPEPHPERTSIAFRTRDPRSVHWTIRLRPDPGTQSVSPPRRPLDEETRP